MKLFNLFRIIRRDSLTLVTNMTGLSLGLAASILLTTFILFELSYDRHFSNAERIFRLNSVWIEGGERQENPICLRGAYTEIPERVAGIEATVQIYRGFGREVIRGDNRHKELELLYADPEFFRVFDLEFLAGSRDQALTEPGTVILSKKTASRIFDEEDPVGQSFLMDQEIYTVTAIVEEAPPNTHFRFDMLMPMESVPELGNLGGLEFFTYYLVEKAPGYEEVTGNIARMNTEILAGRFSNFGNFTFDSRLTPLTRLHLHSGISWDLSTPGSMRTIYIMVVITIMVMGLALLNFINLYILNGARRSREIGLRKVNGADRTELIRQFYLETSIVITISFIAGAILAVGLLQPFSRIMQRESFTAVTGTPTLYLVLVAIYLLTIVISGSYPALLLSSADPIPLIRETVNPAGDKRVLLRLVSVVQVCIAVCLLSVLMGINTQVRFMKTRSPGYEPEGILLISNLNQKLTSNYPALRDRLLSIPGIDEVAASTHTIGAGYSGQGIQMYGDDPENLRSISEYRIRPGTCALYRFILVSGRFLEAGRISDDRGVILNEKATEMLGKSPQEIVGEQVMMHDEPLEVIGVVKDFHFESAAVAVQPLVLTAYSDVIRNISLRHDPGSDPQQIIRLAREAFREFDPDYVMINRFATDICEGYYTTEERLQKILLFGSLFSLLIVMLGIYALVSHHLVSRTKEIGIRKVMGGSTQQMVTLIYGSTMKWSLLASILAIPLSWLYLDRWLNDFVLRIPLYWWIFASSALVVVMFQTAITLGGTRSTARRNPVEALRYE